MKICFYLHFSENTSGGILTYSKAVLNLLLSSQEIENIYLLYSKEYSDIVKSLVNSDKVKYLPIKRSRKKNLLSLFLSHLFFDIYNVLLNYGINEKKIRFLKSFSSWISPYRKIKSLKIDLIHIPLRFSPVYGLDIPLITTMHDLQELIMPENFSAKERLHRDLNSKKAVDESDQIIVSFKHVKEDVKKYFSLEDEQISVCPPPFHEEWFVDKVGTNSEELKNKYGLEEKFILYPAATWKHKNHIALFYAISILREKNVSLQLIITGNITNYHRELIASAEKLGIDKLVKFLGIVPESDLVGLYKQTSLVVIPTTYEAGSGPLYESMRYGIPVICSNVTSLPDAIGNDEFTFDPNDYQRIAELILKGVNDEAFRNRNIENSKIRLNFFKEQDYISNFLLAYRKAIQHRANKTTNKITPRSVSMYS